MTLGNSLTVLGLICACILAVAYAREGYTNSPSVQDGTTPRRSWVMSAKFDLTNQYAVISKKVAEIPQGQVFVIDELLIAIPPTMKDSPVADQ